MENETEGKEFERREEAPTSSSTLPHEHEHSLKTLLSWSAPGRPFKARSKQFYMTALLIAFFIEVILFLFSQYMLMFVVASLVFVGFAFAYVPPKNFHYRISTEGLMIEDHFYIWHELYDFYFTKRQGVEVLNIRTKSIFPGILTISLGDVTKEHVKDVLLRYLPFREYIKPTFLERSGDWLSRNFPLERPQ
ncbi:MAG: hypothetical protein HYW63_02045 [Candidatus Levybacteria bacterium]|nr:hypothetical protein [Candidatus Levybacteria bacterium]